MKKRIIAVILVLAMAICAFPVSAFADNASGQTASPMTAASIMNFYDHNGNRYPVETSTIVSTTTNSSYTGYVIVIQEVLYRYYLYTGTNNYNPKGVDGIFGNNTRLALVSFQVDTMGANQADGVVGPKTWAKLHEIWELLGSPNLTYLYQ